LNINRFLLYPSFFITYHTNLCIGLIIYFIILSSFFTTFFTFFSSYVTFSPTLHSTLYVFNFLFFSHLFISEFSVDLHYKDDIPEIWNTLWVSSLKLSSKNRWKHCQLLHENQSLQQVLYVHKWVRPVYNTMNAFPSTTLSCQSLPLGPEFYSNPFNIFVHTYTHI